jgi:hypothetical protein
MPIKRRLQSFMVIARHQLHAAEAGRFEISEEIVIRRRALGIGDFDREDLAAPIRSDTRGN